MMTAVAYDRHRPSSQLSFDFTSLSTAVQSTYQEIFSAYLAFNRDLYFDRHPESNAPKVNGTRTTSIWGLFPSAISIVLALVLLSLDVATVVILFTARSNYFRAPRIPMSLGSLMPWIAGSEMVSDIRAMLEMGKSKMEVHEAQSQRLYRFGLSYDANEEKRWLLDYDHSHSQQTGSELRHLPGLSIERRVDAGSASAQNAGGGEISSPTKSTSNVSRIIECLRRATGGSAK